MKGLRLFLIASCLFSFYLVALLSSCKQRTDHTKTISQLDSARTAMLSMRSELEKAAATDSGAVGYLTNAIGEIRTLIPSDTVNKATGTLLASLSGLKGMLVDLTQYKANYVRATEESQKRILDLQHDLKEDLIEDQNKAQEYVVKEVNASARISEELKRIMELDSAAVRKLDSLKQRITFMRDSLNSK